MNNKYLIVIEKGKNNYSAYSPDVLGCVVTGKTVEETISNMKEALEFHIEGMLEDGESFPMPKTLNYYIENTDEISSDDILAHIEITLPEMALV
ncbi:MAG: type II toxin-antitoxin system HicB family antitoxin [Acidobacteriota bacterium]|jgi:predicted RNase H-like HicB family nuclease|nr:type II toxin-antitoxin system HicB family antitoxin [Acidobacteriota bacterium]